MCTAITLNDAQNHHYFGRTMDFSYPLEPSIYSCPKNYILKNSYSSIEIKNKYSFMGIGQKLSHVIFADGVNEKGVSVATLYFPGFASYPLPTTPYSKYYIDSLDLVNFLLGNCATVEEAYSLLQSVSIIGVQDSITNSIAPLHWIVTDQTGNCMVIESEKDGLHLFSNPIGVLSNSPNFEWHATNLRNYMNLSPFQFEKTNWNSISLSPFGQGTGGFGLPGDYTPPSRFVRASFLKTHIIPPQTLEESITSFFHIMESVSIPKGIVITQRGTNDYTQYTSFIDLQNSSYYFKTYENSQILYSSFVTSTLENTILEVGKLSDTTSFKILQI